MGALETAVMQVRVYMISQALKQCCGNQSAAAEKLGIHRNTLWRQMKELGVFQEEIKKRYRRRARA